jgi:hypothetical protein
MVGQSQERIKDKSKVTDRRREVDIWEPELEGGSINFSKLCTSTKPDVLGFVLIQTKTIRR